MRSVNANSTTAASSASASAPNLRYALGTQEAGALGSSNASRQQRQQQASTKLALSATLCGLCFAAAFGVSHQHRGGRGTSAGTTMDAHAHHHHDAAAAAGAAAGAVGAMDDMAPMPMYFMNTWHTTLWFKSWETTTPAQYALSILGLVLLAVVHEAIACYRSCYLSGAAPGGGLQEPLVGVENPRVVGGSVPRLRSDKVWSAVLYSLNICSGYMLMLAVMTFNTGYFFAVVIGMGVGYYIMFDVMGKHAQARSDSCHAHRENGSRA